ncbi:MAG TPA: hypothetical protein VK436_07910 [Methanocella sp.]|nr:hypothetical protein [Methanocella sp.]
MMSDRNEGKKIVIVLTMFAFILLLTYFWPFQTRIADLHNLTPTPLKPEVDAYIAKYAPEEQAKLLLPPPEVKVQADNMLNDHVVTQGELNATGWILDHTNESDKFVADIFGAELIMGMTTRFTSEGGDWANAPNPIKMMNETNEIFKTTDPARANALAKALNSTYVWVPQDRRLNTGWWVNASEVRKEKFNNTLYFRQVFGNGDVSIYQVL